MSYELILPAIMTGFFPTSPVASLKWKSREENLEGTPGWMLNRTQKSKNTPKVSKLGMDYDTYISHIQQIVIGYV